MHAAHSSFAMQAPSIPVRTVTMCHIKVTTTCVVLDHKPRYLTLKKSKELSARTYTSQKY